MGPVTSIVILPTWTCRIAALPLCGVAGVIAFVGSPTVVAPVGAETNAIASAPLRARTTGEFTFLGPFARDVMGATSYLVVCQSSS